MDKDKVLKVAEFLRLHQEFDKLNKSMMGELSAMLEELEINAKGLITVTLDAEENKVVFFYHSLAANKKLDLYTHEGFDIYYDPASWEIAKRTIKDIFYDVRKNMKEKAQVKPPSTWEKLKAFIKRLFTF